MIDLIISDKAQFDLGSVYFFGLERWGQERSERFRADLQSFLRLIQSQPDIGRKRPDFGQDIRMALFDPYLIFYRRSEKQIKIMRIVHSASDVAQIVFES